MNVVKGDELGTASGTSVGEGTGFGCRNLSVRGVREGHRRR